MLEEELVQEGDITAKDLEGPQRFWIGRVLLGRKHQEGPGRFLGRSDDLSKRQSDRRRLYSRIAIMLAVLAVVSGDTFLRLGTETVVWPMIAGIISACSIWFFVFVVVMIPFRAGRNFRVNVPRLALDTMVSAVLVISVSALWFAIFGLKGPCEAYNCEPLFAEHIYFSVVTFSTLGYGDFVPVGFSRVFAAGEAVVGNLHLGAIVGAVFLAAQNRTSP